MASALCCLVKSYYTLYSKCLDESLYYQLLVMLPSIDELKAPAA